MRTRWRALHWRSAGQTGLIYTSIGVVLIAVFGLHDSVVVIVFGTQAAMWTLITLIGRSGSGLIGVRGSRQEADWPRPPLKRRTFIIGLAIYGALGAGSLAEAVTYATKNGAFSVVLAANAAVIGGMSAWGYRRMRTRRRDDIIT